MRILISTLQIVFYRNRIGKGVERVCMVEKRRISYYPATEALTVIDVNSGKMAVKSKNSAGAMKVNMEAAQEAAKQIRLRNLSGIIIVDFVNLESKEDTGILLKEFRNFLSKDPIPILWLT